MFYALATALCLAVLFLAMAAGWLLLLPTLKIARRVLHWFAPASVANVLFALRLLPLGIACVATLALALPAFLAFEPHSTKEGMGLRLTSLACLGALVLSAMSVRGWRILRDTARVQRSWRERSERIHLDGTGFPACPVEIPTYKSKYKRKTPAYEAKIPTYQVENGGSLLAVAGIFHPRIFVAKGIVESLSADELRAALAHETAHVSSFDNLKQFLLKITRPPGWMSSLASTDAEWAGASEVAADQAALALGASVLDLSSALIKVGRLKRPFADTGALASHLVPPTCGSALELRITSLSQMLQREQPPAPAGRRGRLALLIFFTLVGYFACIHAVLPAVHEALEFLVR